MQKKSAGSVVVLVGIGLVAACSSTTTLESDGGTGGGAGAAMSTGGSSATGGSGGAGAGGSGGSATGGSAGAGGSDAGSSGGTSGTGGSGMAGAAGSSSGGGSGMGGMGGAGVGGAAGAAGSAGSAGAGGSAGSAGSGGATGGTGGTGGGGGGGGFQAPVACGSGNTCESTNSICCWNEGTSTGVCQNPMAGCPSNVTISCDDNTDCTSGQVCCYQSNFIIGGSVTVSCRETCASSGSTISTVTRRPLCNPSVLFACGVGSTTQCLEQTNLPPGYSTCQVPPP